jgi:hypothetical protein
MFLLRPSRLRAVAASLATGVLAAALLGTAGPAAAAPVVRAIVFPVAGHVTFSDDFGDCRGVNCERSHQGIDLMGPKMLPLVAANDAEVLRTGLDHPLAGNSVVLRDDDGWTYHYVHLNNDTPGTDDGSNPDGKVFGPGIAPGVQVKAGQVVGYLGDSGNAEDTAPHLHFEIRRPDGAPINPYQSLLQARGKPFADVPTGIWYDAAVRWMALEGITTGVGGSSRFEPDRSVTRGEWATFIWRTAGRPDAQAARFADVPEGVYYEDAVRWLRATGLTTGVGGADRYEPDRTIARSELVTMLHRMEGHPAPSADLPRFADVPAGSFFDAAVAWARADGLTTGVGGQDRFDPAGLVTRGQAATFLHRVNGTP